MNEPNREADEARIRELEAQLADANTEADEYEDEISTLRIELSDARRIADERQADAARLRRALEEYADTVNWHVDREQGLARWGWLGGDPTAIAQLALSPDTRQPESDAGEEG